MHSVSDICSPSKACPAYLFSTLAAVLRNERFGNYPNLVTDGLSATLTQSGYFRVARHLGGT